MRKIKILLVDDDEAVRNIYAEVFRKEGFEVLEAVDGLDGLDKATKEIPDIIFTGIMMPRMDGFSLMDDLKKNVTTSRIPVVISSHMGREEDQNKAREKGARDFIVQGYNTPNEVVERLRAIFNLDEYKLLFDYGKLDAPKFIADMHLEDSLNCSKCGGELVISLKLSDVEARKYMARFICDKCGREA